MRPANIWASVVKARSDLSQSLPPSSAVDSTNDSRRAANESALAEGRNHRRSLVGSSKDGPASKRIKTTSSDGANQFWPPKSISESVPIPSIKRARASPFPLSKDSLSTKFGTSPQHLIVGIPDPYAYALRLDLIFQMRVCPELERLPFPDGLRTTSEPLPSERSARR